MLAAGAASAGQTRFQVAPFRAGGGLPVGAATAKAYGPATVLDGALTAVATAADPLGKARSLGLVVREGRVQVTVAAESDAAAESVAAWLIGRGAGFVSSAGVLVQADAAPEMLRDLALRPDVLSVRRPTYAPKPEPVARSVGALALAGSVTTEGLAAMNGPAWHSAGYTGQGVKVGVIDAGFGGWEALRGTELPAAAKVHLQTFGGLTVDPGEVHGTACAEIISDIVPSAEMYLALVATDVDIASAVTWMKNNGVTVISMSLGWLSWGPGDGTGYLAGVVNGFVSGGGVWVNSAGNSRLAHWQGAYRDDDQDGYLNFSAAGEINFITADGVNPALIPVGTTITASMIWNQWSSPATDLDFYLYMDTGSGPELVTGSEDPQSGGAGQRPVEEFNYTTEVEAAYGFVIKGVSGPANVDIEFFERIDGNPLQFNVQDGSITPPADTATAIAAAALDAGAPYALENYSSRGPTNGPGGSLAGGSVKPDIAGYAVVSTVSYGPRAGGGFPGTSAACPHVAGAAALVRSAYPAYSPAQVRSFLEGRAVDIAPSGKDNDTGFGRLSLGTPPAAPCDAPGVPGTPTATPTQPASGAQYTIAWGAGTNATGYEIQEATNSGFTGASTTSVSATSSKFTHTVASNTTYYYRVRAVRSCTGSSASSAYSSTLAVTVTGGGGGSTVSIWVPVATRASGANSSQWRSDVGLLNLGGATASVTLAFKSGATTKTYQTSVAGGRHLILRDVVGPSYLGGSGSGSLEVRSSQAVLVTSRTYNQNANGTFGQDYPAYDPGAGLAAGQSATLPHLTENSAYRTNIGLLNMGTSQASVTVALIDGATGTQVGSYTVTLAAGEWKQEPQPYLKKFSRNNLEAGYARVSVTSGAGVVAVASVIDNNANSNDPTTITMQR